VRNGEFTDEQSAFALKQAGLGTSVEEVCRKMGISDATFYVGARNMAASARPSFADCADSRRRTGRSSKS
jgi:transposase-like protein